MNTQDVKAALYERAEMASTPFAMGEALASEAVLQVRAGADANAIVKIVEEVFEKYIRPFDIPGVPNIVEPLVDDALKQAVIAIVKRGVAMLS